MPRKPMRFTVTVEPPPGASPAALREYIKDAVGSMKGSLHPEDPIFDLDYKTVRVTVAPKSPKKV